jgi:aspartate/methionine/tyrosine aminotransferase
MISNRISNAVNSPSPIVKAHEICASDPYTESNTDGYINMGTAENYLMEDLLLDKINRNQKLTPQHLNYQETYGMEFLRIAYSEFSKNHLGLSLDANNIVIQCGVSALCESLSYSMLDEGDALLVPAPFYPGFFYDFSIRFKVELIPVQLSPKDSYNHDVALFEQQLKLAKENGKKVKGLLITNPHNPTGKILNKNEMQDLMDFAEEHHLEIIADEIYALSMVNPQKKFISFYEIAGENSDHIHLLYGMAKDFGLSGFKVGFFHTTNERLLKAMQAVSYFHTVSSQTQVTIANLLKDKEWITDFANQNQKALKQCFQSMKRLNIPMYPTEAGIFCYADFSSYLKSQDQSGEMELFNQFLHQHKISMTPGQAFQDSNPGYFRICFAKSEKIRNAYIERMIPLLQELP